MRLIAALALTLLAAACGGTTSTETDGGSPTDGGTQTIEPKLSVISAKIFQPKCVSCHADTPLYGEISLTASKAYAQLVDHDVTSSKWPSKYEKRVIAGDTALSALSASIEQRTEIPTELHMPQASKLTAAEVTAINKWIEEGAQNN